jgi:hypothetical protein
MPIAGFPYCRPDQCDQLLSASIVLLVVGWIAVLGVIGFRGLRGRSPRGQHLLALVLAGIGLAVAWWVVRASG